jgi:sugar phosphate isomerase/epimerase
VNSESYDRRRFLRRASSVAILGAIDLRSGALPGVNDSRFTLHDSPVRTQSLSRIGVQLYTVRNLMRENVERTIEQVARIGYKEVEFAGYFSRSAKDIRALLDANGLTAPSAQSADMNAVRNRFAEVLEDANTIGHKYVLCASLPRMERTADGFKALAAEFNQAGEVAAKSGVTFGFHNHDEVFGPLGGTTAYDILLSETDPKLVTMQMDLFWLVKGGKDPLAYFAKYPGRFTSVHVKDMTAAGAMVDVGAGQIPFAKYFAQSKQAGIQHYFVEHDEPGDAMASIAASFKHLRALQY